MYTATPEIYAYCTTLSLHDALPISHAAGGHVLPGFAVESELVGAQELVAAAQRDIAFELRRGFGAAELVAFDVGGLVDPRAADTAGLAGVAERGDRVLHRAQFPVFRPLVVCVGPQIGNGSWWERVGQSV